LGHDPLSGTSGEAAGLVCWRVALVEVSWESAVLRLLCWVSLIFAPASAACLLLLSQIEDEEMDE
jgi:hypothetical protein